ncbi:MAG: hypothetical protein JEZ00_17685 [Anaerolineaceae bacterium]|nr:hypothetical protein [Anaerolineaceae bacterium]
MIDQIGGYTTFSYLELHDHQQRIDQMPKHCVWREVLGYRVLNKIGRGIVAFGKWVIRISDKPQHIVHENNSQIY